MAEVPSPDAAPAATEAGQQAPSGVSPQPAAIPIPLTPERHSSDAGSSAPASPAAPALQLPVVDLIGLRFSLQHLRLVGYGLLAVWGSEVVNLLTTPRLAEIGTRLHYTSQFLDLTPILLVAIGLIAFQGGLRRRPLELAVLPVLLTLLPLLSAVHFFLAPVSVANVITLTQKQQQIGLDQIERIDAQIDRASTILRDSDSIDTLLEGLQRIPGLQVRVPPKASVNEARQEVRRSLERERDRLRERIEGNLSASREAFLRRAGTNAALALLGGLLLWSLHHGAMREMEQAIPFLDWMLVHGEPQQQPEALQELLQFQRACTALGWFSLLERCLRLVRRVVRRPAAEQLAEEEQQPLVSEPPANPFVVSSPTRAGIRGAPQPLGSLLQPSFLFRMGMGRLASGQAGEADQSGLAGRGDAWADADGFDPSDPSADPLSEAMARSQAAEQRREERIRQRNLNRYRAVRNRIERDGLDPFASFVPSDPDHEAHAAEASGQVGEGAGMAAPPAPELGPRQLRRLQRDQRRARQALDHMASADDRVGLQPPPEAILEQQLAEELRQLQASGNQGPPPPRGLAGLWHWFLTHL
jgi:hypothetical protein